MAGRPGCVGVLLAGGRSMRFGGTPKGLAELHGRRMADRVLDALATATDRQVVIANDPQAQGWFPGMDVISDRRGDAGPLAGIEAALTVAGGSAILVAAWDMPFLSPALLRHIRSRGTGNVDAVAPSHGSGVIEPLCAWYAPSALAVCSALLDAGERRARALPDALPVVRLVGDAELSVFGNAEEVFMSVDSAADLERATAMATKLAGD